MRSYFLLLFVAALLSLNGQVTGTATLPGQINHAGIKVKFTAMSTSAVTDSAFTNNNGAYSINLATGIYTVMLSRPGYRNHRYSNGAQQILSGTSTLSAVTLSLGLTHNVSGQAYGTWETGDTYNVSGNLLVPADSMLIIEAGVTVKMGPNSKITANGQLKALGAHNNKIRFISSLQNPVATSWNGLQLNFAGVLTHCLFEHCLFPVTSSTGLLLNYSELRNFAGDGVRAGGPGNFIHDLDVHDFQSPNAFAIRCTDSLGYYAIRCNNIYRGEMGLDLAGSTLLLDNVLHDLAGAAIANSHHGDATIENNIIYRCAFALTTGSSHTAAPVSRFKYNTLYNNGVHIFLADNFSVTAQMNIAVNGTVGITQQGSASTPSISHNLVWNNQYNYSTVNLAGLGQRITVNHLQDSVDVHNNLSEDPRFENGWPPYLSSQSPCHNAGTYFGGNSYASIGATINECSVKQLISGLAERKSLGATLPVFPNPFNNLLRVKLPSESMRVSAELLSISGARIPITASTQGDMVEIAVPANLPHGVYMLKLRGDDTIYVRMVIKAD